MDSGHRVVVAVAVTLLIYIEEVCGLRTSDHDYFLTDAFQFIIHQSFCHSMLYNLYRIPNKKKTSSMA
jgi:hypothetical protein